MRGDATTSHGGGQGQDLPPLTGLAQMEWAAYSTDLHPEIHGKSIGKWMKMLEIIGK